MRLAPSQQHTISLALSSADCAARRQEKGILQQLLLLVFAVAPHTRTAAALDSLAGVAMADCPVEWAAADGAGELAAAGSVTAAAAGDSAAATAAAVAAQAAPKVAAAAFRLFVVARRVTVALVDRPSELAFLMSADAKPFISGGRWRLLQQCTGVASGVVGSAVVMQTAPPISGHPLLVPLPLRTQWIALKSRQQGSCCLPPAC